MLELWIRGAEREGKTCKTLWGWEIGVVVKYSEEERADLRQKLAGNRAQT